MNRISDGILMRPPNYNVLVIHTSQDISNINIPEEMRVERTSSIEEGMWYIVNEAFFQQMQDSMKFKK